MRSQGTIRKGMGAALWATALLSAGAAHAAIPAGERQALLNLYASTNGAGWTTRTNWNGAAGTECTWFGVACSPEGTSVTGVILDSNNLAGTLPALGGLPNLQEFRVYSNGLTGSIPSFAGMSQLRYFEASLNQLTGTIPDLAGAPNLDTFAAYTNGLTGSIPPLSGNAQLRTFMVSNNQLTGPLPALAGLTSLRDFVVLNNRLTGTIPALAGVPQLRTFIVEANQLTGTIPSLAGLTSLQQFWVGSNQLTGPLPALAGLTSLWDFRVGANQLTGSIPALGGLSQLSNFVVTYNQLSGTIPPLTGLTSLVRFWVDDNQLTGPVPALTGLSNLIYFSIRNNQLSGNAPAVPSPSALAVGGAALCPNALNRIADAAWDAATGRTPWYADCTGVSSAFVADPSDIWWNAGESGWGMQMVSTGDFIFATLYVYGSGGQPTWFTGELTRSVQAPPTFTGPLYATTGPYFGGAFNPAAVTARTAGTMTFTATGTDAGQLSYTVDGVPVTKSVQRQPLTRDDYSGRYIATDTRTRSGCADPSVNGNATTPVSIDITHSGTAMTAVWTYPGSATCTHTGTFTQLGRMGTFVATYTCSTGETGTATYTAMTSKMGIFGAQLAAQSTTLGCASTGQLAGVTPR